MPEVITNDLIVLSSERVAPGGFGATFDYDADPAVSQLSTVLDGVTFTTPDGTSPVLIPLGATTVIDGTEYTLSEIYNFWGEFTKIDPATGDTTVDSGQTMALTLTSAGGDSINIISPSDTFTSDPTSWSAGQITSIRVGSDPFATDALYEDDTGNKLGEDDDVELPCFVAGSLVDTETGLVPVEDVRVGDLVLTRDNGYQPIKWVGHHAQTPASLSARPDLAAVLICKGAFGADLPLRDMRVSPWHRLLFTGQRAELLFGEFEVLVPAVHLLGQPGITREALPQTYVHLMFEEHQIIRADGAWSESFQPGAKTLAGIGDAQRAELLALFPGLAEKTGQDSYVSARLSLKEHEARALLAA